MSNNANPAVSLHNPLSIGQEALEATLSGRTAVMDDVEKKMAASLQDGQKHYVLLVGPPGAGKSHVLALAVHRLKRAAEELQEPDRVSIACLTGRGGPRSYGELALEILRALEPNQPDVGDRIREIEKRIGRDREPGLRMAATALREHCRGRTLILVCENLDRILENLGPEGQRRWRSAIQEEGNCAILATANRLSESVTGYDSPFYGFFTIRKLQPMNAKAGLKLLVQQALVQKRDGLACILESPRGKTLAGAIHHLSGGNHRAYTTLSVQLERDPAQGLSQALLGVLDMLSPSYQRQLDRLPPTQVRLLEAMALQRKPATVMELAKAALVSQQTGAKQLGLLAERNLIVRHRQGRNTYCEIADAMLRNSMDIWHNRTRELYRFTTFMEDWFSTPSRAHITLLDRWSLAVRRHGPASVPYDLPSMRDSFMQELQQGRIGRFLIRLLQKLVDQFQSCPYEWENTRHKLADALQDRDDCQIPLRMLKAAIAYGKARDERELLELPLEERRILRTILVPEPTTAKRDD